MFRSSEKVPQGPQEILLGVEDGQENINSGRRIVYHKQSIIIWKMKIQSSIFWNQRKFTLNCILRFHLHFVAKSIRDPRHSYKHHHWTSSNNLAQSFRPVQHKSWMFIWYRLTWCTGTPQTPTPSSQSPDISITISFPHQILECGVDLAQIWFSVDTKTANLIVSDAWSS